MNLHRAGRAAADLLLRQGPLDQIAMGMGGVWCAILASHPTYMGLTAGRHTRMLLACARSYLDRVTCFTTQIPDEQGSLDLKTARQIAARFDLAHEPLTWQEPSQRDLDEWFYRTGGCVVGGAGRAIRTLRQLDPTRGILTGMAGSVGEAEWWSKADLKAREVTCAETLDVYNLPPEPTLVARVQRWLDGLPTRNVIGVLGLRSVEQRLACLGGPQEYGYGGDAFVLSPTATGASCNSNSPCRPDIAGATACLMTC